MLITIKPIRRPGKRTVDPARFEAELQKAQRKVIGLTKRDFNATVRTWKRKPTFTITTDSKGVISVSTDNPIYGYVNYGTKPHIIRPKRGKYLWFQTGYKAKTRPRVISSSNGGASGKLARAKQVRHPGTAARQFDKIIAERRRKTYVEEMRKAVQRSLK
ncbi:MAG: hypothetical protein SF123_19595 [Chloroflexota bacterium]|nr:hypothetical protein [Chloroflexota bacterium]